MSRIRRLAVGIGSCVALAWLAACATAPAGAALAGRVEVYPLPTQTTSARQVLIGAQDGAPVTIAAELSLPSGPALRFPAVVMLHGDAGIFDNQPLWVETLLRRGIAVLTVDSFSGRGAVASDATPASIEPPIGPTARVVDAARALALLAAHPRVDSRRIAVMGFSSGARTALLTAQRRFTRLYFPASSRFAATIALYPPCNLVLQGETDVEAAPIRVFHGLADDVTSPELCADYVARLRAGGHDAVFTGYAGALHGFDNVASAPIYRAAGFPNASRCRLGEREGGAIVNSDTGRPPQVDDACNRKGLTAGPDSAAGAAVREAVAALLDRVFALPR